MRPKREHATANRRTYMVTTWARRALFQKEQWAVLLIDALYHYRDSAYLLHEFVIMPDHIHVLLTPLTSLEKAVQFIKGGFSYRVKKELESNMPVWQRGFQDHRIRDAADYDVHVAYVLENPVRKRLGVDAKQYRYSSAYSDYVRDEVPQVLKIGARGSTSGVAAATPFQNENEIA